ncbi:MAG: hypothetical protein R2781_00645 [Flavobacteriaceae bacterium]
MKNRYRIMGISFFIFAMVSCAGGKDILFEKTPPFTVQSAYFQKWIAGVQGGGSGTNVHITLGNTNEEILINDIFFGDKVAKATQDPNNSESYHANFLNENNRDLIMDSNPIKESENLPIEKSPFTLESNEAVVSYTFKGEIQYYKIPNLEEKPLLAYPSNNTNGRN